MADRPRQPRRAPGPWLDAIRTLVIRGYSDRRIADEINDAMNLLNRLLVTGHRVTPRPDRPDRVAVNPPLPRGGQASAQIRESHFVLSRLIRDLPNFYRNRECWFTRRQVQHYRWQLRDSEGITAKRRMPRWEAGRLHEVWEQYRYAYAAHCGWLHLLPYDDYDYSPPKHVSGYDLRMGELRILTLLHDRGRALTCREIMKSLGLRQRPNSRGVRYLPRLEGWGLLSSVPIRQALARRGRPALAYYLADGVRPHTRTLFTDGVANLQRRIEEGKGDCLMVPSICT